MGMRFRWLALVLVHGCGNDLPPAGTCELPGGGTPTVDVVPLYGRSVGFDDLRFSPQLDKVVAVAPGTMLLHIIDPDSLDSRSIAVPAGAASADASATAIYVADRGGDRIVAYDAETGAGRGAQPTSGGPDYVRVAPTVPEVWVTIPSRDRIEIFDEETLAPLGVVEIPAAAEGLTFDASGHAYTQGGGRVFAVDVARRVVIGEWDTGCGYSHGFAQVDEAFGLVVAGCGSAGGAAVLTTAGELRSGYEAGGDAAILALDGTRHHLYLRGDPGGELAILGTCRDGATALLATVDIPDEGHGATVDDRGHAWVCDATTGGVVRVTDPFPATP